MRITINGRELKLDKQTAEFLVGALISGLEDPEIKRDAAWMNGSEGAIEMVERVEGLIDIVVGDDLFGDTKRGPEKK